MVVAQARQKFISNNNNMNREIILVEVITKSDMSTDKSRGFNDTEKAEKYFIDLIKEMFPTIEQDDIDYAIDNGFYDYKLSYPNGKTEEKSISTKVIILEDDL